MPRKAYPRLTTEEIDRIRNDRTTKYYDLKNKEIDSREMLLVVFLVCWIIVPALGFAVYKHSMYPIPALLLYGFVLWHSTGRIFTPFERRSIRAVIRKNPEFLSPNRLCVYCGYELGRDPSMSTCPECGKERWRLGDLP